MRGTVAKKLHKEARLLNAKPKKVKEQYMKSKKEIAPKLPRRTLVIVYTSSIIRKKTQESFRQIKTFAAARKILLKRDLTIVRKATWYDNNRNPIAVVEEGQPFVIRETPVFIDEKKDSHDQGAV